MRQNGRVRTLPTCPRRRRRRGCQRWVAPETELSIESVPDTSFPSTLLVSFSWRRTDSRGTPSRGTAPCDDWRPPCSPPPRWRPSITLTPAAAAPPVPSFSAAARRRAAPCGRPTGATRPWPPATTDSCPRCSASRGHSCSRCGPASPTRPRLGPPLLEGAGGGGRWGAGRDVVPSQDAIITHSHTPTLPVMQYSPYNVGPRYCNPPPLTPSIDSLCLVPAKWCREGWGCWCSFWDRTGALGWSHQWVQSPVETKVSGRGVLGQSQSGRALILFNL